MKFKNYLKIFNFTGVITICILVSCYANAQARLDNPRAWTTWSYIFGTSNFDSSKLIAPTNDGGYILGGLTASWGGGSYDWLIIKLDSEGKITWQKAFGGSSDDYFNWIEQTSDMGYIITGSVASWGMGGHYDLWVIKLRPNGDIEWQKAYGTSATEYGWEIHQLKDGGYIVSGKIGTVLCVDCKALILRLDSYGNIIWQKMLGNEYWHDVAAIEETNDGGFIATGNVTTVGAGGWDYWIVKLDAYGNIEWQKAYGGPGDEFVNSILQTDDGGYIISGKTKSFGAGDYDASVVKLDSNGVIQWQKTYGGPAADRAWILVKTNNRGATLCNGYYFTGDTASFGAGGLDAWIVKIDTSGNVIWAKSYGGSGKDGFWSINNSHDNGILASGETLNFGAGYYDVWAIKLDSNGQMDYPCIAIRDIHLTVGNSNFITTNTNFTATSPNVTVTTTPATGINTTGVLTPVCSSPRQ